MSTAWIPIWILGAPIVGILLMSMLYSGGHTAAGDGERPRITPR